LPCCTSIKVPSFKACAIVSSAAFKNDATISRRVINSALSIFSRSFFAKAKRKDGPIGADSDYHTKTASFALPRSSDPLLDDLTAKISIDQTPNGSFDGLHKAVVTDAVLSRKLRKRFGFENAHRLSLVPQTIVCRPIFQGENAHETRVERKSYFVLEVDIGADSLSVARTNQRVPRMHARR
jgi:hypothetical protein